MQINTSNANYDFMNAMVRYVLPAIGTLYFALSDIWNLPYATQVVGTIVALEAFFGVLIYLARRGWKMDEGESIGELNQDYDGDLLVNVQEEGEDLLTVSLDIPIESVRTKENLNLRILPTLPTQE